MSVDTAKQDLSPLLFETDNEREEPLVYETDEEEFNPEATTSRVPDSKYT